MPVTYNTQPSTFTKIKRLRDKSDQNGFHYNIPVFSQEEDFMCHNLLGFG